MNLIPESSYMQSPLETSIVPKVALVTGTNRGLGLAFVRILLERDYHVFAGYFLETNLDLCTLASQYGDALHLIEMDISSEISIQQAAKNIKKSTRHIDLLVNNAGILGNIEDTIQDNIDFDDILHTINVNAIGSLRVSNAFVGEVLSSQDKTIINISSEAGSIGQNQRDGRFGYCMSKAALNMEGALIHTKIKPLGGRVIQIHPGWVKTYMNGSFNDSAELEADDAAKKILQVIQQHILLPIEEQPAYLDTNGNHLPW